MQASSLTIRPFDFQDLNQLVSTHHPVKNREGIAVIEDYVTSVLYRKPMNKKKTFSQINKIAEELQTVGLLSTLHESIQKIFKGYFNSFFAGEDIVR